jgi:hypothetical protein
MAELTELDGSFSKILLGLRIELACVLVVHVITFACDAT